MKTSGLQCLLLASRSLFARAARAPTARYQRRVGLGHSRYGPRISDRHHRGVYGRDYHSQN